MNLALIALLVVAVPLGLAIGAFVIWLVLGYLGIALITGMRGRRSGVQPDDL